MRRLSTLLVFAVLFVSCDEPVVGPPAVAGGVSPSFSGHGSGGTAFGLSPIADTYVSQGGSSGNGVNEGQGSSEELWLASSPRRRTIAMRPGRPSRLTGAGSSFPMTRSPGP